MTEIITVQLKGVVEKHFGEDLQKDPYINTSIKSFLDNSAVKYGQLGKEKEADKTRREDRWQTALCVELMGIATGLSGQVTKGLAAECYAEGSALFKSWRSNPTTVKRLLTTMAVFEMGALSAWRIENDEGNAEIKGKEGKLLAFLRDLKEVSGVGEGVESVNKET